MRLTHIQDVRRYATLLFCALIITQSQSGSAATPKTGPYPTLPCTNVRNFGSDPIINLPVSLQSRLRQAVGTGAQAVISDPGMGMQDTKLDTIPLNALKIAQISSTTSLYAVSWQDRSFGVNGVNWIVEVTPAGATNLTQPPGPHLSGTSPGFGVEVLDHRKNGYPEVMFASKGFKVGGGAEAEERCLRKTRRFYQPVSCPAKCHRNLNGL